MSKLVFKIGEETLPTIMDSEMGISPFGSALNKGKMELTTLLRNASSAQEQDSFINKQRFFSNNILSFLGDRGSGKTSCMLSLIHLFQTETRDIEISSLGEKAFFMPLVDPAFFDKRHNILEIVIGELYRNYKDLSKEWSKKSNIERNDIIRLQSIFTKAKTALHFLNKKELAEDLDENAELLSLSYGVDLNRIIEDLICQYLKCCGKSVLVIAIDDLDLNLEMAYEMMEQIRKYLVLPNVVIMLAAKLSQLQTSIAIHYKPILKNKLINDYEGFESVDSEILEMAERYLDKLLPMDQRIFMPYPESYSSCELEIIWPESGQKVPERFESVEFAVLSLIFKKCGFLFYNSPSQPSLIVPRNLRELRLLVSMLYRMEPKDAGVDIHLKNKEAFKKYLFEQWMSTLIDEDFAIVKEILQEHDWTKINKLVVSLLNKNFLRNIFLNQENVEYGDSQYSDTRDSKMMKEIICKANVSENLSIGDVWFIMEKTRETFPSERIDRLLFSISSLYSIWLYELYDDLTERHSVETDAAKESGKSGVERLLPHLKNTDIIECHDFFKLVGNSFFTLSGDTFIPLSQGKKPRELVMIDGIRLGKEIAEVKKILKTKSKGYETDEFILKMQMIEFFMLGCSRWVEPRPTGYSVMDLDFWRTSSAYKLFASLRNVKNILFDATAPFVNLISPKDAYKRFDPEIYELLRSHPKSILSLAMSDRRYDPKQKDEESDLQSRIAIRNMEIFSDLYFWLLKRKNDLRPNNSDDKDLGILRDFYHQFREEELSTSSYTVKTYDMNEEKTSFYLISFKPLNLLSNFLENLMAAKIEIKDTFYSIFRPLDKLSPDTMYSAEEIKNRIRQNEPQNVATKEKIVSNIIGKDTLINSNVLVQHLAQYEYYSIPSGRFSKSLDAELFEIYRSLVTADIKSRLEQNNTRLFILNERHTSWRESEEKLKKEIEAIKQKLEEEQLQAGAVEADMKNLNKELLSIQESESLYNQELKSVLKQMQDVQSKQKALMSKQDMIKEKLLEVKEGDDVSGYNQELEALKAEGNELNVQSVQTITRFSEINSSRVETDRRFNFISTEIYKTDSKVRQIESSITNRTKTLVETERRHRSIASSLEVVEREQESLVVEIKQDEKLQTALNKFFKNN